MKKMEVLQILKLILILLKLRNSKIQIKTISLIKLEKIDFSFFFI